MSNEAGTGSAGMLPLRNYSVQGQQESLERAEVEIARLKGVIEQLEAAEREGVSVSWGDIIQIPREKLVPFDGNHRKYFDPEKLENLRKSVEKSGINIPLFVRQIEEERYQVIAGERRYRVAEILELPEVPCIVRDIRDEDALELSLTDNFLREDPNPLEKTRGLMRLLDVKLGGVGEEGIISLLKEMRAKQEGERRRSGSVHNVVHDNREHLVIDTLERVGSLTWRAFLTHYVPTLNLPDTIKVAIGEGKIQYTKALAIAKIEDVEERDRLLEQAISDDLPLSAIKEQVMLIGKRHSRAGESQVDLGKQVAALSKRFGKGQAKYREMGGEAKKLADKCQRKLAAIAKAQQEFIQLATDLEKLGSEHADSQAIEE